MDKFAESLKEGFKKDPIIRFDIDNEDGLITKFAGMTIYQPTLENIEAFIRKYTLQEVASFPRVLKISIFTKGFKISENDSLSRGYIDSAYGIVELGLHNFKIELPFIVKDSELLPFDIIQMKGERVPYSRENLIKILSNIDRIHNDPYLINENSPYAKLDDRINDITDPGFLGDTLRIQEQAMINRRAPNRGEIVVRAEKFDTLLEKTSRISPINDKILEKVANFLTKKYLEEFVNELEKTASDNVADLENHTKLVFSNLKDLPFESINSMANGTHIKFPEKDGKEIKMVRAIVLKDIVLPHYGKNEEGMYKKKYIIIVVTEDRRFIILEDRQKFYALRDEGGWVLPSKSIKDMDPEKMYLSIVGNQTVYPFICESKNKYNYEFKEEGKLQSLPKPFRFNCQVYPEGRSFNIVQIPGAKFNFIRKEDASAVLKRCGISMELADNISKILPYEFFGCDEKVQVIELKGTIKDYLINPKELMFTLSENEIFKSASSTSGVAKLRLVDKDRDVFDLSIEYKDTSSRFIKMEKREFKNINSGKVKGILKTANIDYTNILVLINRTLNDGQGLLMLPDNATPEKISGGYVEGRVKSAINKIKNSGVISREGVNKVLADVIGVQIGSALVEAGPKIVANADRVLSAFASQSEALGIKFEKLAQEYNSPQMLDIAKLMVAQNRIDNALKDAYNGEKIAFVKDCARIIKEMKPDLEKIAYDLIELKTLQFVDGNELVSPNVIGEAVRTLDRMYKIANAVEVTENENEEDKDKKKEIGKKVDLSKEEKKVNTVENEIIDNE